MKTIGLLGGMSWESTIEYYRALNTGVKERLGGLHSAKIAMVSLDFDPIERLQHQGGWERTAEIMSRAARDIEVAGADCLLICTNTMHKVASQVQAAVRIPLLHIADATARAVLDKGYKTVGLLGTAFTMEQPFYRERLEKKYGIEVKIPGPADRETVHRVIYQELCCGQIKSASRKAYLEVIEDLAARGAETVILGCTEIGLLVRQEDTAMPLLDTVDIHAKMAVDWALDHLSGDGLTDGTVKDKWSHWDVR